MEQNANVWVVGAGSFGTTVATLLAANTNVLLFSRKKELVDKVNLTHEHLGVVLNPAIRATNSLEEICAECSLIFSCSSFRKLSKDNSKHVTIIETLSYTDSWHKGNRCDRFFNG